MNKLKKELEAVVLKVVKLFEKKQGVKFQFFVSDNYMGTASFEGDLFFSLDDIYHDVFTEQPKGQIMY